MKNDIQELLRQLEYAITHSEEPEKARKYYNAILQLQSEIINLKKENEILREQNER